jgi:uncharacterized protein
MTPSSSNSDDLTQIKAYPPCGLLADFHLGFPAADDAAAVTGALMSVWIEAISLRILISEDDTQDGHPLHETIIKAAREAGVAGAKVMRGVAGYGRSGHIHESWRGFSYDLPVVVELIDSEDKIDAILPSVQRLRQGALVIRQRVQVLQP